MAGFFYDSENDNQNFTSVVRGVRPHSLEFLPFNIDNVTLLLQRPHPMLVPWGWWILLCRLQSNDPEVKILSPSTHDVGHAIGEARLAFDPTASSHFHVIEYVDINAVCAGVEIYSSQTTSWIYKKSE
jgi:hypothetical protein